MIQLPSKNLLKGAQKVLDDLQKKVDDELSFGSKVNKAQSLWKSKGGLFGKAAFIEVRKNLYEMCSYVGVCNYCEQSEANDIEHVYPKSFFPEKTFVWENYILACKQCNSGYKLDRCYVLNGANEIMEVLRGTEPIHKTVAFINPKIEDPNNFMILNLMSFKFDFLPGLNLTDKNKAIATLQILELNERDTLLAARKSAGRYYYELLDRLKNIIDCQSIAELENILTPFDDRFDLTQPLDVIKSEIRNSYKEHISGYQHPSVWYAIKIIGSKIDSKWQKLFERIPEALTW